MVSVLEIEQDFLQISEIFSALGSPTRLKIIELISQTEKPLHIKAIAEALKKDYAAIYRHVKVLEKSGIVGIYEVGRSRVIYPKNDKLVKECVVKVKNILQIR